MKTLFPKRCYATPEAYRADVKMWKLADPDGSFLQEIERRSRENRRARRVITAEATKGRTA